MAKNSRVNIYSLRYHYYKQKHMTSSCFIPKKSNYSWIILLFSLIIIFSFLYVTVQTLSTETYPLHSDEYGYSKNIESFLQNHILASALTLDEKYSKIGNFSFHGFSYTATYGSLMTALHVHSLIIINIFLSISTLVFILFIRELTLLNKVRLIAPIASYSVFFLYSFSYMVESIHLFLSAIITYIIYKYFTKNSTAYRWIFIFTILTASFLRQTWFIYIFAIFFQAKAKKKLVSNAIIIGIVLLSILTSMYLFYAPYEHGFLYHLLHDSNNIYAFSTTIYENFIQNLKLYFLDYVNNFYYFSKMGLICLLLCISYYGYKEKNRFLLSISFIGWSYFFILLLLYNATAWRELRVLSVVYISALFALSIMRKDTILNVFLVMQLLLLPSIFQQYNDTRTIFYRQPLSLIQKQKLAEYAKVSNLVKPNSKKEILIIIDNGLLNLNYDRILGSLPIKTKDNIAIKYSISYFTQFDSNKTKGDYLLTSRKYKNFNKIMQSDFFNLYKIGKQQ